MQSLQLVSNEKKRRNTAIASQRLLDDARASAMENILNNGSLSQSLTDVSTSLGKIIGSCHTQVLSFNHADSCFRVLNKTNDIYNDFITQVSHLTLNNFQSDIHLRLKNLEASLFADIHHSKDWRQVHLVATELGVVAVWVVPVISNDNKLCGAFLCLFNTVREADASELDLIQRAASSVAAMLFHGKQKTLELKHKVALQKQISKQQEDIHEVNLGLQKALIQRNDVQSQLVEFENMAAIGTMMSSLTHEINTPIGVSLTASSYLTDLQQECLDKFHNDQLKRSELHHYIQESHEASYIIQRNIIRANELIDTFKRLSIDQDSQDVRVFNLCDYVYELLLSLKPRLKTTPHKFCIDIPAELTITSNPGALSQVLTNLIMNSLHHAFLPKTKGRITIRAKLSQDNALIIDYTDNGCGMAADTLKNMYKPFFSQTQHNDSSGLGLYICNNLVMKTLKGAISCHSELNKGTEFNIEIPVK